MTESAWNNFGGYEVCISEIVLEELYAAPEKLRAKFINVVAEFKVLNVTKEAERLAKEYVKAGIFPEKYFDDAHHVAIASVNDI